MPTGYTSKLYDGKPQTFNEFMLGCARAFGALITMRDDPSDAEIPEKFEPSPYYTEQLAGTRKFIATINAWSEAEAEAAATAEYEKALGDYKERRAKDEARRVRYQAMLDKVTAWEPPSSEHRGLKDFCIQQLSTSIDFDCDLSYPTYPVAKTGRQYKSEQLVSLKHDLGYYTEELRKEEDRTNSRNEWVAQLRASLTR